MDISQYLLQGFNILPQTSATVNGVAVSGVFNQSSHRDEKMLGGYGPQDEAVYSVKQSLLPTNPSSLKGKIVVLNDRNWRIMSVRFGQTITHLTIVSPEQA
jgi:hypothetical protein